MRLRNKYRDYKDTDKIPFLIKNIEGKFHIFDYTLTSEDQNIIQTCTKILGIYSKVRSFYHLFIKEFDTIMAYSIKQEEPKDNEINRLVVNFVSNSKLFIDFLENVMKKDIGQFYKEWKKEQSKFFDTRYEYSLLYHLRNHVQHVGLPIKTISSKLVLNEEGEEITQNEFNLSIETLLEDSSLHSKPKSILKKLSLEHENLSIIPIIKEYSWMIQVLYLLLNQYFVKQYLKELDSYLLYYEKKDLENQIFVAYIEKKRYIEGDIIPLEMTPLTSKIDIIKVLIELEKLNALQLTIKENSQ